MRGYLCVYQTNPIIPLAVHRGGEMLYRFWQLFPKRTYRHKDHKILSIIFHPFVDIHLLIRKQRYSQLQIDFETSKTV